MTRDNQVIKMKPFYTSDTLPLSPHLGLLAFSAIEKDKVGWLYNFVTLFSTFKTKYRE